MAEPADSAAITETKNIMNPRVEIDTSPPFESVKEAVDRFGGSGPFFPRHLLRLAAAHPETEAFNVENMEEQAVQLERDLIMKEQETLNVLKELEAAKRFVEDLKINLMPEFSSLLASPYSKLENSIEGLRMCPDLSPGLIFMELNQAKSNLNKTSTDLAVIQSSIESLNKKMRKDKALIEKTKMQVPSSERVVCLEDNHHQKIEMTNTLDFSMTISKEMNFEAEQFKKITEASRYEVMKAITEIERTKNSIKMAEMRLNAAKKMEEAAKAVEAIAVAERKALLNGEMSSDGLVHKTDGITLSIEEYRALTQRAQQGDELCKTKFIDTNGVKRTNEAHDHLEVPVMEKFEQAANESKQSPEMDFFSRHENKFKFRNSHPGHRNTHVLNETTKEKSSSTGFWSKTSIGDVLSRKLILRDDVVVGRHVENHSEREHVSLSQMLREQSRGILHPTEETGEENVEKRFFVQRKKFGFIQVPVPTKQSKKKTRPVNLR